MLHCGTPFSMSYCLLPALVCTNVHNKCMASASGQCTQWAVHTVGSARSGQCTQWAVHAVGSARSDQCVQWTVTEQLYCYEISHLVTTEGASRHVVSFDEHLEAFRYIRHSPLCDRSRHHRKLVRLTQIYTYKYYKY